MASRSASRLGATCAIAGSVLLFIGTYLHPMEADPNQAIAAFAEYAADRLWVASHLTQLAGVALILAALLLLAQQLRAGRAAAWAVVAAGAATVSLAVAVALQAVDGMALKLMVDAWAAAPATQKEGLFHALSRSVKSRSGSRGKPGKSAQERANRSKRAKTTFRQIE